MATNFLKNASFYGFASMYYVVASVISFPILTRLFEVSEYGILGLVTATIPLIVGIGKFGMQHATVRFYSEIREGHTQWNLENYYSTVVLSVLAASIFIFAAWQLGVGVFGPYIFESPLVCNVFILSVYVVVARILESITLSILRAREDAYHHSLYKVIKRTLVLVATISVLFFYRADLIPYFVVLAAAELLIVILFIGRYIPLETISLPGFDPTLLRAMMLFGIPMFGIEFGGAIMNVADRYIINAMLGAEKLGVYASAFTLVEYGQGIITTALVASAVPVFLRLYNADGEVDAVDFLRQAVRMYFWAAIPVVFIIASAGTPFLTFLAGEKYQAGSVVMPWVAAGLAVFGMYEIVAAGIYLRKKTLLMLWIILATAAANIALNLFAVPRFGIVGAAATTLICNIACVIFIHILSQRFLKWRIPWFTALKATAAGAFMYFILELYAPSTPLYELLYKGLVGVAVYAAIVLLVEREVRERAVDLYQKYLVQTGGGGSA